MKSFILGGGGSNIHGKAVFCRLTGKSFFWSFSMNETLVSCFVEDGTKSTIVKPILILMIPQYIHTKAIKF